MLVKPIGVVDIENDCEYDSADSTSFTSDPAPHFQIFYVPESLADYHWNSLRSHLESEYENLDKLYKFGNPQPINFYLMPCRAPSVHYDKYYGFMVNPVKNSIMAIYNHKEKAATSVATNMLKLYQFWGYAPRFFVEGIALFGDLNDYYVKKYRQSDSIPYIGDYFVSDSFTNYTDRTVLKHVAGSFCYYLARVYGIEKFKQFYDLSSDLTAAGDLGEVYGKSTDLLVKEWYGYLDTVTITPNMFYYQARRVAQLRNLDEALMFLKEGFKLTGGSRQQMSELGNYCYLLGRYEGAKKYFGMCLAEKNAGLSDLIVYANMLLMNGMLDSALVCYEKVISEDSTKTLAYYKIGRILQYKGNLERAIEYFRTASEISETDELMVDAQLGAGQCFWELGDSDSSKAYFVSALETTKLRLMGANPGPLDLMRASEAFLYLGQPEPAIEHLELCFFVEERPFYLGRIALAYGQAYDMESDREKALAYYQYVLDVPGGFLSRKAAESYIAKPFTLNR